MLDLAALPPYYLFLGVGGFFALASLNALLRYILRLSWPQVHGRVLSVHGRWRTVMTEGLDPRDAVVVYEYSVAGQTYTCEMAFARGRSRTLIEPNTPITVYYHPRNPRRSYVDPQFAAENYLWFALGVTILLLVYGALSGV
jgi:hypothetical protein